MLLETGRKGHQNVRYRSMPLRKMSSLQQHLQMQSAFADRFVFQATVSWPPKHKVPVFWSLVMARSWIRKLSKAPPLRAMVLVIIW